MLANILTEGRRRASCSSSSEYVGWLTTAAVSSSTLTTSSITEASGTDPSWSAIGYFEGSDRDRVFGIFLLKNSGLLLLQSPFVTGPILLILVWNCFIMRDTSTLDQSSMVDTMSLRLIQFVTSQQAEPARNQQVKTGTIWQVCPSLSHTVTSVTRSITGRGGQVYYSRGLIAGKS